MQMVSHGLMTALFFAVIGMIYERTHTRLVNEMGGLLKVMPFIMTYYSLLVYVHWASGIEWFCCRNDGIHGFLAKC